jgi:hypothetical protein
MSNVDHPAYYGGADSQYEAIKVIEAWGLGFNLGNCVKYLCRAGKKTDRLEDLQKAAWYLGREIDVLQRVVLEERRKKKSSDDGLLPTE